MDRVDGIHREMAAQAQKRRIDFMAAAEEFHFLEQRRVARVVKTSLAVCHDKTRRNAAGRTVGQGRGMPCGHHLHFDTVQIDRPAQIHAARIGRAFAAQPFGDLVDGDDGGLGGFGDVHRVTDMIAMAVGDQDIVGLDRIGRGDGFGIAAQEGVDQQILAVYCHKKAGMAERSDMHGLKVGVRGGFGKVNDLVIITY